MKTITNNRMGFPVTWEKHVCIDEDTGDIGEEFWIADVRVEDLRKHDWWDGIESDDSGTMLIGIIDHPDNNYWGDIYFDLSRDWFEPAED